LPDEDPADVFIADRNQEVGRALDLSFESGVSFGKYSRTGHIPSHILAAERPLLRSAMWTFLKLLTKTGSWTPVHRLGPLIKSLVCAYEQIAQYPPPQARAPVSQNYARATSPPVRKDSQASVLLQANLDPFGWTIASRCKTR